MSFARQNEIVIGDDNYQEHCGENVVIDGERKSFGLIPRNYATHPVGCYESAKPWGVDLKLIPRNEWSSRIKDKIQSQSQLSDIRLAGNGGAECAPRHRGAGDAESQRRKSPRAPA